MLKFYENLHFHNFIPLKSSFKLQSFFILYQYQLVLPNFIATNLKIIQPIFTQKIIFKNYLIVNDISLN